MIRKVLVALLVVPLGAGAFSVAGLPPMEVRGATDEIDAVWMSYLDDPPQEAVDLAASLATRADTLASSLVSGGISGLAVSGAFDVVVSGGGNLDAYYMGIRQVFSRVADSLPEALDIQRHSGASAGGMMPFEMALKGEDATVKSHLSYGVLAEQYSNWYRSVAMGAYLEDHHWRMMAEWQTNKFESSLSTLDGKIFLATSCFEPLPTLVIISNYTAEDDQATHAFMSTGTYLEMYDGMACTDGGMTSGPNMTPLFQDGVRPQIIVDLMQTGYPTELAYKVNLTAEVELAKRGQDEAIEFLTTGAVSRSTAAITLCPVGSRVDGNICE